MSFSTMLGLGTDTCGVDIGLHTVRVAQLSRPHQHAKLRSLGESNLPAKIFDKGQLADVDGLAEAVKSAALSSTPHPVSAKAAVAALPESLIFTRVVQLPNLPPAELKKAIPYEASQFLPVPIDDVYFDYTPLALRPDKNQIDAAVFAAPKSLVDNLVTAIRKCRLEIYALETKSTAVVRCLLPTGSAEARLIVDIGSESTRMTVADHGNVWLTTSVNTGENQLTKSIAEKVGQPAESLNAYLADHKGTQIDSAITMAINPIVQEALSAIRYHETRDFHSSKIQRVLIVGQGASIPGILPAIINSIHTPCETGLPLVSDAGSVDPRYSVALGLSMRSL